MIYHKERETNKSTPDIKLMNDNFHNKTSSAQFNETNKVLNRSHPGLPIPIISVSNRYNTSHSTNRLNQNTTELSSQHQIESDSIVPNENESEIKLNKNYIYQNTTPTNQINITHGNNIDSRTSNNKDQSYSFIPVQSNNPHRINSENLNLNNNRKIENVSILPNEDSDYLPTNKSNATDNFRSKNILADYQSHDLSINNNFNHNRDRSINIMHNHPPDNDKDDDNGVNDNDNDDNNKDEMIINVETENSSSPYNQLRDLDGGKEIYNLSGMKPLKTVVYLSIGPLMNQITSAIESFIETIWVSKAIGIEGMTAISSYMPFENITRAFGLTTACAGSNTISGFIANNESDKEEGSQVIADLLRVCLIIGIIVPAVLCPLIQMAVKWLGASDQIVKLGYKYILPILICTFFTCSYLGITGFLEGEGRPILYTVITLVTSLANILFLCPLFLFGFETGIVGAGLAQVLSHTITATVLFVLYFTGHFTVKPKFNQLFKKFSPLTKGALKACLSQGIANLTLSIPAILIRKLIGMLSISEQEYNNSVTSFHAVTRYTQIVEKIIIAFVTGYLPAASFAYCSSDFKRWLFLTLHVNWLCFAWGCFTAILTFSIPKQLAEAFLKESSYLKVAAPMIRISNSGAFFIFAQYTVGNMLRSLKMGFMAAVMGTLVHIVGMIGFSLMLYYTNKHNAVRLMYAYPLSNLFGMITAGAFIAYPSYILHKEWKFNQNNGINNENDIAVAKDIPRVEMSNLDAMH